MTAIEGRAWKFGDNIDTDVILPGKYLVGDLDDVARYVMDGVRPGFADLVTPGDVIVAGRNFGTGSSREMAPLAIQAAGIKAVVAESFARIFFRNCINVGLPPIECPEAALIEEGKVVRVDVENGTVEVVDTGVVYQGVALPEEIGAILRVGGMENYLRKRLEAS